MHIQVPDNQQIAKPFEERPDDDWVADAKQWIKDRGSPHLHPDHTHSNCSKDEEFEYLAEFCIPEKFRSDEELGICPLCRPNHPCYVEGRIAWFKKSKLVRFIGHDCFKSRNRGAHEKAERELQARERLKRDKYLIMNSDAFFDALEHALSDLSKHGHRLDLAAAQTRRALEQFIGQNYYRYFSDGLLRVREETRVSQQDRQGNVYESTKDQHIRWGSLPGATLISPKRKKLLPRSDSLRVRLQSSREQIQEQRRLPSMDNATVNAVARKVRRLRTEAVNLIFEFNEQKGSLYESTLKTLRAWSSLENCECDTFYMEVESSRFSIGRSPNNCREVSFSPQLQFVNIDQDWASLLKDE